MTKLKIALLINNTTVRAYQANFIREIVQDSRYEIVSLLIFNVANQETIKAKYWHQWMQKYVITKTEALNDVDLTALLSAYSKQSCSFLTADNETYYIDELTALSIKKQDLDVIINCLPYQLSGKILTLPHFGVWSFCMGEGMQTTDGHPIFWDLYYKKRICQATLQRLTDASSTMIILRQGYFGSDTCALHKTLDKILFESSAWINSILAELWHNRNRIHDYQTISIQTAPTRYPNRLNCVIFSIKMLSRRFFKSIRERFYFVAWNIGIIPVSIENLLADDIKNKTRWLPELPWPRFQADPFGMENNGEYTIYFEEGDHASSIGKLKIITLNSKFKEIIRDNMVTNFKCHHSYPFIIENDGKRYLLPEALQSKQCVLYEIQSDQKKLKAHTTLIENKPIIDPTLINYNGLYWLFCTLSSPYTDGNTALYIYYSEKLEGPYKPHLLNPVKTDIRSSRPAGTFFFRDGKLYRPAQDCLRTYGGAIKLLEIQKLTPTEFIETVVTELSPHSRYSEGLHTLSTLGKNHVLIDGKRHVFSIKKAIASFLSSRTVFSADDLNDLIPLSQEKKLTNFVDFSTHLLSTGIDSDCWCNKKVEFFFRLAGQAKKLQLKIDFPGWQKYKKQRLAFRINDNASYFSEIKLGTQLITVPLSMIHSINKISITSQSEFRMPYPDNRRKAFYLCELSFG